MASLYTFFGKMQVKSGIFGVYLLLRVEKYEYFRKKRKIRIFV